MNTVIYTRYSAGPRQTDQSIEGQLRVCTDFCKQRGLTVIDTYCDRHISGRTDERPEFQRLIADAKRKKFEAVVVYMKDRLVIDWGKGTINWCQNGTTEKELLEIRPAVSEISFTSYDKVLLSFETLHKIVYNKAAYKEWEEKLSAVAGVYLITDTKTGKHYVGSASGEQGGLWGRWSEYARTKHGGNKRLKELITADADYCNNFQYSILEVFPIKRDKHEVLEYEQLYKKKLWSIQFGLNDN